MGAHGRDAESSDEATGLLRYRGDAAQTRPPARLLSKAFYSRRTFDAMESNGVIESKWPDKFP